MLSGKLAAETAVESIEYNDFGILKEYELRWRNDIYENNQYELYALKEMLLLMDVLVRAEVIEKLWSTASQQHVYPFKMSNVMKRRDMWLNF